MLKNRRESLRKNDTEKKAGYQVIYSRSILKMRKNYVMA
ncbi:hypothetical protein J5U21_01760 [Saccharolobus shibatae]|uniref:Uncharacterized protein n=1 Tax=Saccharolobus shibatae TaxID=2286 RepID=A0A8F5BVI7_9CREN|nr:hypothetical protein J5U21_01760 [Saccharolobus shibatae]